MTKNKKITVANLPVGSTTLRNEQGHICVSGWHFDGSGGGKIGQNGGNIALFAEKSSYNVFGKYIFLQS